VLRRVEWAAVLAVLLSLLAITAAAMGEEALGIVFALSSVTWAILSLKEKP
jgi:hypothetical protein